MHFLAPLTTTRAAQLARHAHLAVAADAENGAVLLAEDHAWQNAATLTSGRHLFRFSFLENVVGATRPVAKGFT